MKKLLLLLLLLVCFVLPVAVYAGSDVTADDEQEVVGYFNYYPTGCLKERWFRNTYIGRDCHDTGEYGFLKSDPDTHHGDFVGESTETYAIVLAGADRGNPDFLFEPFKWGWYAGIVRFEGTVGDSEPGTMWIRYIGKSPGSIFVWSGGWRILGGEDGLEGIRGRGTWANLELGSDFTVRLEGEVYFDD